ncbi:hypothetical protein [Novosphingobium sp. Gsoil 351]|nr:hypothetical protein [Novosphingobium sp. Gsoil 351]QGN55734.1 hypothetical protein GKE62_15445 [Novosphingobium sp. Gsoil 351]
MTTRTPPRWHRIARLVVIGTACKAVIVGGAWLLAMDALHSHALPV